MLPKPKATAKPKLDVPEETPDLERHDEVYFRNASGPLCGRVLSRGVHGATIDVDGERHRVPWADYLGHKTRVRKDVKVVDQGEDGFLVEAPCGSRRFVRDPMGAKAPAEESVTKSYPLPTVLLFASQADMLKAIRGRPGLTQRAITDKRGRTSKHWVRVNKDAKGGSRGGGGDDGGAGDDPPDAGAENGYGTHNLEEGDTISFKAGDFEGEGRIASRPGKDGAYVTDSAGRHHQVRWSEVTGHKRPPHQSPPPAPEGEKPERNGESFAAADYAREHDDPDATPESVLAKFPPDTVEKIEAVRQRLDSIETTEDLHAADGKWAAERKKIHKEILEVGREGRDPDDPTKKKWYPGLLSTDAIAKAIPEDGKKPTLTLLGGRGGSGKSWFKGKVYSEEHAIVIDADEIKHMLPEYEGWNAHQVHEESSYLVNEVKKTALDMGLNLVIDATMKTKSSALETVDEFKKAGFDIEAHYMHLPRQEAASRAVGRFLGKTQRYVPVDVVLGNTKNEETFDAVRKHAKRWSFRDNNVPRDHAPKLIAEGGNDE